jgi:hypothetical protein
LLLAGSYRFSYTEVAEGFSWAGPRWQGGKVARKDAPSPSQVGRQMRQLLPTILCTPLCCAQHYVMALYQISGCQERRAERGNRQQPTRSRYCTGRRISQGIYCEGMKVCQKAGCTSRSRHKQTSKWGCESAFRASSSVKRSCSLCSTTRVSTLPNPRAHVNPRRLCSA